MKKLNKIFVLYGTEQYIDTLQGCVNSLNQFSDVKILVYLLNSSHKIQNAKTIKWEADTINVPKDKFINRKDPNIYKILIERPRIIKHALTLADTVVYVDADSIATKHVNNIFNYTPNKFPLFVEGIYDYLHIDGRGGADSKDDLSTTLEHSACELFGVNQYVRERYRQTGYFIANNTCNEFIDEWIEMCNHPDVLADPNKYAPYHEETIANVLLWKHEYQESLPYLYINSTYDKFIHPNKISFTGESYHLEPWIRIPDRIENLMFYHGEKDLNLMNLIIDQLMKTKQRVLFLAPHLSTGGMPAFLLKRIKALQYTYDIYVVEYSNYSDDYTVQKDEIKSIVKNFYTLGPNKLEVIDIIKNNKIDVVHIDEMIENIDIYNEIPKELLNQLYSNERTWRIIETCHNVTFNPSDKVYIPDAYAFCTPHHLKTFKHLPENYNVITFPIERNYYTKSKRDFAKHLLNWDKSKQHVVNIGLWTPGKNQGEGIEIARMFPEVEFHFVGNQAVNFKEYWEPLMQDLPENVHIYGERNDTENFLMACDVFMFNSTIECNPLVLREAINFGKPILARNLLQYDGMFDQYITNLDMNTVQSELKYLLLYGNTKYGFIDDSIERFKKDHVTLYTETINSPVTKNVSYKIYQNFIDGPFLEIKGTSDSLFKVEYYDGDTCIYSNTVRCNSWVRLNRRWVTNWNVKVWENDILVHDYNLNYENKRIYIAFESSSLGDTIAWIPYVLEFKKKHNCHVIVSTFKNELFENEYPELEFVKPGTIVENIYGMYKLGWFYNADKEPVQPNTIPLQKAASNILGLKYKEIKPRIKKLEKKLETGIVTIATNSTAGCKFWTKEGWQEVINYLHNRGFVVINTSLEDNPFDNCEVIHDKSLQSVMSWIGQSELFIGLSSGLSWLAWALDRPVVMISNFTEADHEFKCNRVTNTTVCNGCWNKPEFRFDQGDWEWCPINKGTEKQFECQKSITPEMVIEEIKKVL